MEHDAQRASGPRQPVALHGMWCFRGGAPFAILLSAVALAACSVPDELGLGDLFDGAFEDFSALAFTAEEPLLVAAAEAADAPHIYMDLQHDSSDLVSVIFAIDRSKDGTPSDDPAVRLTPDAGKCNPQIMRYYEFPEAVAGRPVFSQDVALGEGITLEELPNLMAIEATSEMMRRGLILEPEESRPQNVCSRKLWAILVDSYEFAMLAGEPTP